MHHIQQGQWANQTVAAAYLSSDVGTLIRYRKTNVLEEGIDWVKKGDSQTSAVVYNLETCKAKLKAYRKKLTKKRSDRMSKMMHKKHKIASQPIVEVHSVEEIAKAAKGSVINQERSFPVVLNLNQDELNALKELTQSSEKKVVLNGIELTYSKSKEDPSAAEIAKVAKVLMQLGIDMIGSKS